MFTRPIHIRRTVSRLRFSLCVDRDPHPPHFGAKSDSRFSTTSAFEDLEETVFRDWRSAVETLQLRVAADVFVDAQISPQIRVVRLDGEIPWARG